MNFGESITTCMQKYATFSGRASRSEFWWFYLLFHLTYFVASFVEPTQILAAIVGLGLLLPVLAVGARRLHDIGQSAWLLLLLIIPLIGVIVLIVMWATDTKPEGDKYDTPDTGEPTS